MSPNLKIKSITLENFQIFENKTIELTDGLNILIGDNNSGKSSIIRAVQWVHTNKPSGVWMCRFNQKGDGERLTARVKITYSDDTEVIRIRGEKENKYILKDNTGEFVFEKFGRSGIPEPISEFIGKTSLPMNKDIVPNISSQDELPFMVFESGPTKGSLINYLTGVDVADKIKKELSQDVRAGNKLITQLEDDRDAHEIDLEKYEDLNNLEEELDSVSKLHARYEAMCCTMQKLKHYRILWEKMSKCQLGIASMEKLVERFNTLPQLQATIDKHRSVIELANGCLKLNSTQGTIKMLEEILPQLLLSRRKHLGMKTDTASMKAFRRKYDEALDKTVKVTDEIDLVSAKLLEFEGMECPTCKGVIHV